MDNEREGVSCFSLYLTLQSTKPQSQDQGLSVCFGGLNTTLLVARYPIHLPPRGQEEKVEGFTFSKSWTQMPTPSLPSSASSGPVSFLVAKLGMAVLALQNVREFNGEPDKRRCQKSITATGRSQLNLLTRWCI